MAHFKLPSSYVARAHTILSAASFSIALILGLLYHYKKIVKNAVAGYPEEFWPSVSATVGDWYPERSIFQIIIAFTSGPRLGLVFLEYLRHSQDSRSKLPVIVLVSGLIRTLCCGGWVFITSSDDHDVHDFFMISYMVCNLPWMLGCIWLAPAPTRRKRIVVASAFFLSLIPLVYFFIQHQVHRVPGAYTKYSFFEWGLIVFDVLFDSLAEEELRSANIQIYVGETLVAIREALSKENETALDKKLVEPVVETSSPPETAKEVAFEGNTAYISRFWVHISSWKPALSFASSVYLSYIFWSIFTSLIPTLFYFSIWELGISGQELALTSVLSPIFLSIGPIKSWAKSRDGSTTLHVFSLLGLTAFVLDKPVYRLLLVFFASVAATMKEVVNWAAADAEYPAIVAGLGLLLSSLSKHANHSNNPVWPFVNVESGGYNKTGLILAILAIYEHHTRQPAAGPKRKFTPTPAAGVHWLSAALPLGSLIFTLHAFLSDSSTLIAWSWTGYINAQPKGPLPHMHGSLTFIAQSLGLLLAIILTSWSSVDVLAHPFWLAYGAAATAVLYASRDWTGYIGALNMAFFTMSVVPLVFKRASAAAGGSGEHIGKVYFTAMLVYCLLGLASVWTVAYAFVPGGVYLRERTDLVLIAQMACLSLAFEWPGFKNRPPSKRTTTQVSPSVLSYSRIALACFSVASLLVTMYRIPTGPPRPYKSGPRVFNAGIWTVHFGFDNQGRDSQRMVRDVVRDMELDVVGLLETDLHRITFGNRDLTRILAEEGYYVDIGPGYASHTWGAVLLSKFPIINSTHWLLPSPDGELAPAIEAVLDVFGTYVTVVVAHNGQEETPLDRELQSIELAKIMASAYPRPTLFLGYVVTKPHAERPSPYKILVEDGRMHDIDQDDYDRWCEYILYRGMYRTSYARISRGRVTDTELQIGQFTLPPHGTAVVDESHEARYLRSYKEDLPEHHWFPMSYYPPGVHQHVYHVFGTPLYYKIPTVSPAP